MCAYAIPTYGSTIESSTVEWHAHHIRPPIASAHLPPPNGRAAIGPHPATPLLQGRLEDIPNWGANTPIVAHAYAFLHSMQHSVGAWRQSALKGTFASCLNSCMKRANIEAEILVCRLAAASTRADAMHIGGTCRQRMDY